MLTLPLLLALLAAPQYEVRTLEGATASGTLVALTSTALELETPTGKQTFPINQLLDVTAPATQSTPAPVEVIAELTDGSRLSLSQFTVNEGTATLQYQNQPLSVPLKSLRSVRFRDPEFSTAAVDSVWHELAASAPVEDLLVIRKKLAIDSTTGVVGNITPENIDFTLDGEKIAVKRSKVEGIVFARTANQEQPTPACIVRTTDGSLFHASKLELLNDSVKIIPADDGGNLTLPLSSIRQFDFSGGKVAYLSDLDPESFSYESFFAPAQPLKSLNTFYRLRRDLNRDGSPLQLDGQTYRKGLSLSSRSVVSYRLPGKFRLFKALAGIDDAAGRSGGHVELEILGNGKSLWKGAIRGGEKPQTLELDISGVRTLQIVADFGEGQDIADHLDLCEAKITK
jgi:hypothetical protein